MVHEPRTCGLFENAMIEIGDLDAVLRWQAAE
jgi:hypothetical protein